jgi:hypothetical protein
MQPYSLSLCNDHLDQLHALLETDPRGCQIFAEHWVSLWRHQMSPLAIASYCLYAGVAAGRLSAFRQGAHHLEKAYDCIQLAVNQKGVSGWATRVYQRALILHDDLGMLQVDGCARPQCDSGFRRPDRSALQPGRGLCDFCRCSCP